ncbi:MAG: DNA recombination protein RmuC [Bacteroidota bacterium]
MEQITISDLWLTVAFGLILGALLAWLVVWLRLKDQYLPREQLAREYIHLTRYEDLQRQSDLHYENLQEAAQKVQELNQELARIQTEHRHVQLRVEAQTEEMTRLQAESRAHFERVADKLLEEKSQRFSRQNSEQMQQVLEPLRERIKAFEEQVERRFVEETRDRVSLREEIGHLRTLNTQLSTDANNLAGALRGDSKTQGDWGEWQLEGLLRASGLEPGIHYRAQPSFSDENGKQKRPDFIVNLPDDKQLIIDSKVSLTAYERYHTAPADSPERAAHLRNHLQSIRRHCRDLSRKNYTDLYQINCPDYLVLFVPVEPAFSLAIQQDRSLFLDALDLKVVLVTSSTLLATLRTVSYLWKQEKQKQHVIEIAKQSGMLYDKFVNFVDDLREVGKRLDQTQRSYQAAMHKLTDGTAKGQTLIGRAERLRQLGAKTKKKLPKELLLEEE